MPSLTAIRLIAYRRQGGRCLYCNLPIWLDDPDAFRTRYPLIAKQLALRRCTAEHLVARQDGGNNAPGNIAAACWLCNWLRHRRPQARSPDEHRKHVRARLRRGAWLPRAMVEAFRSTQVP